MSLGYYGTSHHALEDIAVTRAIADLAVVCAADANQLRAILRCSLEWPGAMYIRLGRGRDPEVYPDVPDTFQLGKGDRLREGADLTIIATGSEVRACLDAAEGLATGGIEARVVDMHTIDPLDRAEVLTAAAETGAVLTVEEHNITGGLGSAVAEALAEAGAGIPFRRHGVPDEHVVIGPPAALYDRYRLDAAGIEAVARELIGAERPGHD
jgi:transketolase